jgi:hypothetical protein
LGLPLGRLGNSSRPESNLFGTCNIAIVCNDEGECWHVRGNVEYKPEFKLHVHPDDWKWAEKERFKWREHEGRGYWRGGKWVLR